MTESLHKRLFLNTNWILAEKVSKLGLTAITSILVARYLGAEGLGALSIALTLYSIFSVAGTLGLERVLLKELEETPQNSSELVGGAIILRSVGALAGFVFSNLSVMIFYAENVELKIMTLVLSSTFFVAIGNVFEVFYRRELLSKYVTAARVLGLLSSALIKLSLIWAGAGVAWFVLPVFIELLVVSGCFWGLYRSVSIQSFESISYSWKSAVLIWSSAWPLIFSGLVGTLYFQLDKIVIFQYLSEAELGRYALLFQLVSMSLFAVHALNMSATPILNKLFYSSRSMYWKKYQEITLLKFLLGSVIAVTLYSLGNVMIPLLAGSDFTYSPMLLMLFAIYILLVSVGSLQVEYCLLIGIVKPLFYMRVGTLVLNLALNLVLIPIWGLVGAAIASVVSYFINQFVLPMLVKNMRAILINNFLSFRLLFQGTFYKYLFVRAVSLWK